MPDLGLGPALTKPEAGGWTPRRVANLEVFTWFKAGNCFSSAYPTETLAGVGDSVQWVKPLYGTTNRLIETVAPPTLRADGLEFDGGSAQRLQLSTPLDMASCTIFAVADRPTGAEDFVLASGVNSYVAYAGTDWFWSDMVGAASSAVRTNDLGELFYLGNDNGTWHYEVTGTVGSSAGNGGGVSNLGVEEIGYNTANTFGTNPDCRYRLLIVVSRYIALGSPEFNRIAGWILSNLAAELYGNGYVNAAGDRFYRPGGINYYIHP